jgi:ribosomal protein S18 acetylase RimI-like enzyme
MPIETTQCLPSDGYLKKRSRNPDCTFREVVGMADAEAVRRIVESTGFFHAAEVDVAVELVETRLAQGERSGYFFIFCDAGGQTIGYTCFGPIACTVGSFDLYWIAVHQAHRGGGLGRELLVRSEARVAAMGGRRVYIETSSRAQYEPTRAFYLRCGYKEEARLKDFYAPSDDKVIYVRELASESSGGGSGSPISGSEGE